MIVTPLSRMALFTIILTIATSSVLAQTVFDVPANSIGADEIALLQTENNFTFYYADCSTPLSTGVFSYGFLPDNPYHASYTDDIASTYCYTGTPPKDIIVLYEVFSPYEYQSFNLTLEAPPMPFIIDTIPNQNFKINDYFSIDIDDYFDNYTYYKIEMIRLDNVSRIFQDETSITRTYYEPDYATIDTRLLPTNITFNECNLLYESSWKRHGLFQFTRDNYYITECMTGRIEDTNLIITNDLSIYLSEYGPSYLNQTFQDVEKSEVNYLGEEINVSGNRLMNRPFVYDRYFFVWNGQIREDRLYAREYLFDLDTTGVSKNFPFFHESDKAFEVTITAYNINGSSVSEVSQTFFLGTASTTIRTDWLPDITQQQKYVIVFLVLTTIVALLYNKSREHDAIKYLMYALVIGAVSFFCIIGYLPMVILVISALAGVILFVGWLRKVLVGGD